MIRKLPKEHRQKKRGRISVPVSYTVPTEVSEERKRIAREGTTADLSESGLGIFSDKEIKPGTLLEIECRDIWEAPKRFTVRWCNKVTYNFFRIGLKIQNKQERK